MSDATEDERVEGGLVRDEHLTRLATWAMNTLGLAVAWAIVAAVTFGLVAAFTMDANWLWVAAVLAPVSFAWVLYNAAAPMPRPDED